MKVYVCKKKMCLKSIYNWLYAQELNHSPNRTQNGEAILQKLTMLGHS